MTSISEKLVIDPSSVCDSLCDFIRKTAFGHLKRTGVLVGLSGGIDSAVMVALAVKALGAEKVVGLILPEKESNPISAQFATKHAESLGIEYRVVDISPTVESIGGYSWRDSYIASLIPQFKPGYLYNITLPADLLERDSFTFYNLQVQLPDGTIVRKRLDADSFRTLTAFASTKIRTRMINLYWEAERRNLAIAGTTNRTEYLLGDFCKYGDGGTDMEPLSHLYKNQIYQLAHYLKVTTDIINRTPSPDTFSLPVSDQEFFFRIPFDKIDHLLYAWEYKIPVKDVAVELNIPEDAVKRAFRDFTSKFTATAHLRELPPMMTT